MIFWIIQIFSEIVVRLFILYCIYRIIWEGYIGFITTRSEPQPYEYELIEEERFKPEEDKLKPDRKFTGAGDPEGSTPADTKDSEKPEQKPRLVRPPARKYQNFQELFEKSLEAGVLYEDPEFPAVISSVFVTEANKKTKEMRFRKDFGPTAKLEWLHTFEIASTRPQFYPSAALSHSNIMQGALRNCWLVAAISVISMYPELMAQVAPPTQKIARKKYAGIFLFHFWSFGHWIDVVVDDRLPCVQKVPFSIRSKNDNEFLYPLLEKAYAKMYGSYEALEAGFASDAFVDLTGGIAEFHKLKRQQVKALFADLLESFQMQSLIACLTKPDRDVEERKLPNGLVAGHAYSVTKVCQILVEKPSWGGKVRSYVEQMIQLRNPYGRIEWNGAWSDGSKEWQWVSNSTKKEIDLKHQDDGEFWMSFQDFVQNFYCVEIVHLTHFVHVLPSTKIPWDFATFHGEWVSGVTNGGATKMAMNPQYRITLTEPDKLIRDGKCIVCIALTQKYRKNTSGLGNLAIGFCVYHLPPDYEQVAPALMEFFNEKREPVVARKSEYIREVSGRYRIPPGPYIVVPFAYHGDEGQFLLRVFSSGHAKMCQNDPPLNSPSLPLDLDYDEAVGIFLSVLYFLAHGSYQKCVGSGYAAAMSQASVSRNISFITKLLVRRKYKEICFPQTAEEFLEVKTGFYRKFQIKGTVGAIDCTHISIVSPPINDPETPAHLYMNRKGYYSINVEAEVKRYTELFHRFQAAEIGWKSLKVVMDHFGSTIPNFQGFNKEAVRSVIACVDEDRNGKIDYREFILLFQFLEIMKRAFVEADEKKTGTLPPFRFKEIMSESGYDLPQAALSKLCIRYSRENGSFHFDDFILWMVKTHVLSETFEFNQSKSGLVKFNYQEWFIATIFT